MSMKTTTLTLAAAFMGAVSMAMSVPVGAADSVKCYGIAKAGENDCANAAGTHSCKGQSTEDYFGGDWKAVSSVEECSSQGGEVETFEGANSTKKSG